MFVCASSLSEEALLDSLDPQWRSLARSGSLELDGREFPLLRVRFSPSSRAVVVTSYANWALLTRRERLTFPPLEELPFPRLLAYASWGPLLALRHVVASLGAPLVLPARRVVENAGFVDEAVEKGVRHVVLTGVEEAFPASRDVQGSLVGRFCRWIEQSREKGARVVALCYDVSRVDARVRSKFASCSKLPRTVPKDVAVQWSEARGVELPPFPSSWTPGHLLHGGERKREANQTDITFEDIVGCGNAKKAILEALTALRAEKGKKENGMLLHGPSGVGKTMVCESLKSFQEVSTFYAKVDEMIHGEIGGSLKALCRLFDDARKASPSVIVFDNVESVFGKEDRALLVAFLQEMDVLGKDNVVVVATTRDISSLSKELILPGRLERVVDMGLPGEEEQREILEKALANVDLEEGFNVEKLLKLCSNWSPADLVGWTRMAGLVAIEEDMESVSISCFEEARNRIQYLEAPW